MSHQCRCDKVAAGVMGRDRFGCERCGFTDDKHPVIFAHYKRIVPAKKSRKSLGDQHAGISGEGGTRILDQCRCMLWCLGSAAWCVARLLADELATEFLMSLASALRII